MRHISIMNTSTVSLSSSLTMGNLDLYTDIDETLRIKCRTIAKPELCKNYISRFNHRVLSFNIRSLQHNFLPLLTTLRRFDMEFDALVLTECWLQDSSLIPQLPGYNVFHTKNYTNKCGGVTIYVKNCWSSNAKEPSFDDANCLIVNVANTLKIVGIYRSPAVRNLDKFNSSLEILLDSTRGHNSVLITGDMNIDLMEDPPTCGNDSYQCLMSEYGFLPAITEPTRGKACLDHAFLMTKGRSLGLVCNSSLTDHDIVIIGLSLNLPKVRNNSRTSRKTNYHEVTKDLSNADWTQVLKEKNVNDAVIAFNKIILDSLHKHSHIKTISRSKFNIKPWITPGLMKCMRHRDNLHLQVRSAPKDKLLNRTYTRYKNFCNNLLHKLKSEYENAQLVQNHNNPKNLWKAIKDICNIPRTLTDAQELLSIASDPKSSLDNCNKHFVTAGSALAESILNKLESTHERLISQFPVVYRGVNSLFLAPTDACELNYFIQNLKPDSASGLDGITPLLLKFARAALLEPLTHICNLSLVTGVFPDCWKIAVITPVHKSGSTSNPDNYRPISLLSILSKILEKVVNKRLVDFLEKYELLSSRQFGFRRGKSTEDAVQLLTETVSSHLDGGKRCIGAFLDLAKAFDTISKPILLQKLECIGIRGNALSWFASYLSNRKQCVRVGQYVSSELSVEYGVPQGSILGPTLFTVYMDNILRINLASADIICYADDTVAIFHGKDWQSAANVTETGMSELSRWLDANLLTLNLKKTSFIPFHITRATGPDLTYLKIHNVNCQYKDRITENSITCACNRIERADNIKYLGIVVDQNLSFKNHITILSKKVRKQIYLMKILRSVANFDVRKLVYKSLCQSLLQYCIGVWGGAAKTSMIQLERAQRSVLKVMLGKPRRFSTDKLYEESGVLRVRQLFILRSISKRHPHAVPETHSNKRRRPPRQPLPRVNTAFATRLPKYVQIFTYNAVCRKIDIKPLCLSQAKSKLTKWLFSLSYAESERLVTSGD